MDYSKSVLTAPELRALKLPSPEGQSAGSTIAEKQKHCQGCYNDVYNHGCGGAKQCWSLEKMVLVMKKKVHINDVPPWNHKPRLFPNCYRVPQFVMVDADRKN